VIREASLFTNRKYKGVIAGTQIDCYCLIFRSKGATIKKTDKQTITVESEIQRISSQMKILTTTQRLIREFLSFFLYLWTSLKESPLILCML